MKKKLLTTLLLSASVLLPALTAAEELHIRIDSDASADGTRILVTPFSPLSKVIEADLQRSGRFALVDPTRAGGSSSPEALRAAGAEYAVVGSQSGGLDFQLINVNSGQAVGSFRIPSHPNQRRMAHKAADLVFEKLTGVKGAFDTRIAYVSASGPARNQTYQLIVSDSDGFNPRTIVSSRKPVMSPSWSPDARQLAYVSYESGRPVVYVQDLASGGKRAISDPNRSSISPSWSPDGNSIAYSVADRGNYNIVVANASGGGARQITNTRGINVEPQWASSNTLVFTSDRSGQPQLYQTAATGGGENRISFSGGYNAGASIAGNTVAMVQESGNTSKITLMNAATKETRTISRGSQDDSPAISPNGVMVLYATDAGGRGSLAVASDNGKAHQILYSQAGDVRDPAWSPYLD
ncbi:Tol-Pal system beta propeller repeat protein TolB [Candidatus Thiothrix sp. Deng01]|uniref:Tol-Pal system beta propeller repeat protein TolB n=1 Tax=Candidatus Thiothrix phosphatis TaxID=3112415 RepID=A0ABU6D0U5_9GAMM|nr:Tol-Pal system beta propeller repeat protein TolB [Candidatus Thiothrix sp. Deng01]MEB4592655.1 Tol-Pal system beta propeller repeat protein TolB [Candidatus Thiothrix sp. Deng01]